MRRREQPRLSETKTKWFPPSAPLSWGKSSGCDATFIRLRFLRAAFCRDATFAPPLAAKSYWDSSGVSSSFHGIPSLGGEATGEGWLVRCVLTSIRDILWGNLGTLAS